MATILAMQLVQNKATGTEPGEEPEPVGEFDPFVALMILWILVGLMSMIETWKQEFPWPSTSSSEEFDPSASEAEEPNTERRWLYWDPTVDAPSGASSSRNWQCEAGSTPSCENVGSGRGPKKRAVPKIVRPGREMLYTGHGGDSRDEDELHVEACPLKYEKGRSFRSCYLCQASEAGGRFAWITKFGACYHNRINCKGLEKATSKGWIKKCSCCTPESDESEKGDMRYPARF
jgi:hypothetical protein